MSLNLYQSITLELGLPWNEGISPIEGITTPANDVASVKILQTSAGSCDYTTPATDCIATSTYEAVGYNMVPTTYLWTIESGAATIVGANNLQTVTVQSDSDENVLFVLKVVVDPGPLSDERPFIHNHQDESTPAAPTITSVIGYTESTLDVIWIDNATDEVDYVVSISDGGPFTEVAVLPAGSTTYTITGLLNPSFQYTVKIGARNSFGSGEDVDTGYTGPLPPFNLLASTVAGTGVEVTWELPVQLNTAVVELERSTPDSSSYLPLVQLPNTAIDHIDTTVSAITQYYYKAYLTNIFGSRSSDSNDSGIYTPAFKPIAPTGLVATADSASQITVTWVDNATTENDYRCERSPDGSTGWVNISGSLGAQAVEYIDTGLDSNATWYYRSICTNTFGDSDPSNVDSATTLEGQPAAPTNLRLSALVTDTSIPLEWDDNADNETSYTVQRSDDGSSWVTAESLPADSTSVTTVAPATYTTYQYRVFCSNGSGPSNFSNILQVWSNKETMLQDKQLYPLTDKVGGYILDKTG